MTRPRPSYDPEMAALVVGLMAPDELRALVRRALGQKRRGGR